MPLFISLIVGFLWTVSVEAVPVICNERKIVLEYLSKTYDEVPVAYGVTNYGALIEILSTPEGDTWTIIVTGKDGISCISFSGEAWRKLTPELDDPDA